MFIRGFLAEAHIQNGDVQQGLTLCRLLHFPTPSFPFSIFVCLVENLATICREKLIVLQRL